MSAELKECPVCGGPVHLEKTHKNRHEIYGDRQWWGVRCTNTVNVGGTCAIEAIPTASPEAAIERWNRRAPAIAPPVAAGSVDTLQRYDLAMSWGETAMEDCTSGDWVRYDDAIAWNAQEYEREKNASSNCIKLNEELIQEQKRAEKAEFLLADALDTNERNVALLTKAEARVKELQEEIADLQLEMQDERQRNWE